MSGILKIARKALSIFYKQNGAFVQIHIAMKKVILIEDEATMITGIVAMLEALGFVVRVFTSLDAIEKEFGEHMPESEIIILDGHLNPLNPGESTQPLFQSFSPAAKALTIINSSDEYFKLIAKDAKFEHIVTAKGTKGLLEIVHFAKNAQLPLAA